MSYFLTNKPLKIGEISNLGGEEAKHILLSRRMKGAVPGGRQGEKLNIQDLNGKRFLCEFITANRHPTRTYPFGTGGSLDVLALEEITPPKEPALKIYIFQALIKEQPLDNILQKATELGATGIFLFNSERSVDRINENEKTSPGLVRLRRKLERWNKITLEAAKQSDRISPLKIIYLPNENLLLEKISEIENVFILEPGSIETFSTWTLDVQVNSVGILVGPEGGFSEKEVETFSKLPNVTKINMGPRILRADTAQIAAISIIQSLWGDLK